MSSSKLYRHGTVNPDEPVAWLPVVKGGVSPARPARESSAKYHDLSLPELQARVGDLEQEVKERSQSAYQRGLAEGEAGGRQHAAAQLQAALERLAETIEDIVRTKPRLRHEAEEDVVKLALAIARRILYRELATDPDAILGLVRAALDRLDGRDIPRVRVHPQDAPVVQRHFERTSVPVKIEVCADAGLARGSAVFETPRGSFDASVDTQLNEIERGFADLVRRSPA